MSTSLFLTGLTTKGFHWRRETLVLKHKEELIVLHNPHIQKYIQVIPTGLFRTCLQVYTGSDS